MTRLLCTMLLCALGTAQASAQTAVSQQLLELEDDERNAAFTLMLQDGHRKCDQVVRTLFRGTVLGVDEWEAMCRDRRSYSFTMLAEPDETVISFVSCNELCQRRSKNASAGRSKNTSMMLARGPQRGAVSTGIRLGWDDPPAYPN